MITDEKFLQKEWPQHCGDILIILEKSNIKDNSNREFLWEATFKKYPFKIKRTKGDIIQGKCVNPEIERIEFLEKEWFQKCGDTLIILEKTNIIRNKCTLFRCKFKNIKCEILETKVHIKRGVCDNPLLPWKSKENFEKYLRKNFKENKPTFKELIESFNYIISEKHLRRQIKKFKLEDLVTYAYGEEENSLRKYIQEITGILYQSYNDVNYELDIFLESIAFEFNGLTFHEEGNVNNPFSKPIGYHEKKFKYFLQKGIIIFFIWDYFWFEDKAHTKIRQEAKDYVKNVIYAFTIYKDIKKLPQLI